MAAIKCFYDFEMLVGGIKTMTVEMEGFLYSKTSSDKSLDDRTKAALNCLHKGRSILQSLMAEGQLFKTSQ